MTILLAAVCVLAVVIVFGWVTSQAVTSLRQISRDLLAATLERRANEETGKTNPLAHLLAMNRDMYQRAAPQAEVIPPEPDVAVEGGIEIERSNTFGSSE